MSVVRIPFRIFVGDDLWCRRVLVWVEPRTVNRPTQSFADPVKAMAYAQALSRAEGWPIFDRRDMGPAAA